MIAPYRDSSPKNEFLSLITHSHVGPNLYEFVSSVEHKIRSFEKYW